ncbi:recombinase family protein [Clostridium estertheticum]|uniref:recombinase family protein n=1 Tax=Clostridium estertheticum TaxID=238834 RepID=UPI0013E95433|nr:recombinase family protein [Clostridium estertheticum]MBZ9688445.1 recombinase family protein [Clostridium estertheticum]
MSDKKVIISDVAIYLRKSRAEETEKDLANHLNILLEVCDKNNWKYRIYKEIASGATIEMRPQIQQLLSDVKQDLYDAVLVVDVDRLGRGKSSDFENIKHTLVSSNTFLCIVDKVMDLTNDNDDIMLDFQFFFARMEYKQITKRLSRGKKRGSIDGYWTNGIPPYPYEYQKWGDKFNERSLVVNDDKLKIYRGVIDSVLIYKTPLSNIAFDLNRRGIESPKGAKWSGVTIGRLLTDETHLGKIVTNKTIGNGHKRKPSDARKFQVIPKEDQIVKKGKHEAVKTEEEHERIQIFLARDTKTPKRRSGIKTILPFTFLIKCAKCGHNMTLQDRKERNGVCRIKPCWYVDPCGNKCGNSGGSTSIVLEAVNQEFIKYEDKILQEINGIDDSYVRGIEESIKEEEALIKRKGTVLLRAKEAYQAGIDTLDEYKESKVAISKEISDLKEDMKILELKLKHADTKETTERLSIIKEFADKLAEGNLSNEQLNNLYKVVIYSIVWERNGDDIKMQINFI